MTDEGSPRKHDWLMNTFVVVSVVAVGIVIAGITIAPPEPELTVQPVTTTPAPTSTQPAPEEYVVVTPDVEYPTTIPGCDTVEPPVEASSSSISVLGPSMYDNPVAPWFGGPKAHVMSEALLNALPSDLDFSNSRLPYFDPIPANEGGSVDDAIASTNASFDFSRSGRSGYLSVGVSQRTDPIPPCVAGGIDRRDITSDGTVVDTLDTWQEVNGARTSTRIATAYRTDGSWVTAYQSAGGEQDALPMSLTDQVRIVTDPAFATSTPVPAGTPGNVSECSPYSAQTTSNPVRAFTATDVARLNPALRQADPGALSPSPPLGALRSSVFGGGLCQVVNSAAGILTVTVGGEVLPDQPQSYGGGTRVSVPTPSGLGVTFTTENIWDAADLDRIARTAGLDLP